MLLSHIYVLPGSWRNFCAYLYAVSLKSTHMKTRKQNRKVVPKTHRTDRDSMPTSKRITEGEFEAEEELAEKHFSIDDEWKPARKSKGADEEGWAINAI